MTGDRKGGGCDLIATTVRRRLADIEFVWRNGVTSVKRSTVPRP